MEKPKQHLLEKISALENKIDCVLNAIQHKPDRARYLTAQDIENEFGIDQRTILNRSNLPSNEKRFIPSLRMKGRRKYFERTVVDRLLKPNR